MRATVQFGLLLFALAAMGAVILNDVLTLCALLGVSRGTGLFVVGVWGAVGITLSAVAVGAWRRSARG